MVYRPVEANLEVSGDIRNISNIDASEIVKVINDGYGKERVRLSEINVLKNRNVYDKDLWLGYYEDDKLVAVLIGDNDPKVKESSLEQLVVLKEYRNQGIASKLVLDYLSIASKKAKICTIFTRCDTETNPINIFKRANYTDEYHWYVFNAIDRDKVTLINK